MPTKQYASASAFVRDHLRTMSTGELIAAGAKQGFVITANLVRVTRHKVRKENGVVLRTPANIIGSGRTRLARATGNDDLAFRSIVCRIGTLKARELLTAIERTGAAG